MEISIKKSIVALMVTIMFAMCSMECVSESSVEIEKSADNVESVLGTYVGCGYTETGIYYEVYGNAVLTVIYNRNSISVFD